MGKEIIFMFIIQSLHLSFRKFFLTFLNRLSITDIDIYVYVYLYISRYRYTYIYIYIFS